MWVEKYMRTKPIGVGVLGCGFIARAHLRGYLQFPTETRIVALCDQSGSCNSATLDFIRTHAAQQAERVGEALRLGGPPEHLCELHERREALLEASQRQVRIYTSWQDLAADPDV